MTVFRASQAAVLSAGITMLLGAGAHADSVTLVGPTSAAGTYSSSALAADAAANPTTIVNFGGLTGISLWGLLGGANGDITTTTPAGDNGKNAILRDYVIATGSDGTQSVVSLGEINPAFGGTAAAQAFIVYQTSGGSLLSTPELVVPGAASRTVSNVTGLQLLSVPALPTGPGGISTSLTVSGLANNQGVYTLSTLQSSFTPVHQLTNGDNYTGIPLNTFLNLSSSSLNRQIVVAAGTDGYEVVYSAAELTNPIDILPYADTTGDFPNDGIARTILPNDNKHGRWVSNVSTLEVDLAVPGPIVGAGLPGLVLASVGGLLALARRRRQKAA
jgi:hypothetical protein